MNQVNAMQYSQRYTKQDHETWSILFRRQTELVMKRASSSFNQGLEKVDADPDKIPELEAVNNRLSRYTDWSLVPARDLVQTQDLFRLLSRKQFPVSINIRSREDLDFAKVPDIFHDFYGHVPLLTNPAFADFLVSYANLSLKCLNDEEAVGWLERLFWYTVETGLIYEEDIAKPYGAAIITSSTEICHVTQTNVPREKFNVQAVVNTPFSTDRVQPTYFIIESLNHLSVYLEELQEMMCTRSSLKLLKI
jgi:phenylalanine-4-hydroxylase